VTLRTRSSWRQQIFPASIRAPEDRHVRVTQYKLISGRNTVLTPQRTSDVRARAICCNLHRLKNQPTHSKTLKGLRFANNACKPPREENWRDRGVKSREDARCHKEKVGIISVLVVLAVAVATLWLLGFSVGVHGGFYGCDAFIVSEDRR
jgi:hypothetical protein